MTARVLVLRDREAALDTARDLRRRGREPLLLPLQEIVPTEEPFPEDGYSCIAVTSRNAVPALERHLGPSWIETIAVGEATAERLRAAGYRVTFVGAGSAEHLVPPAVRIFARRGHPVLLALGRVRSGALEEGLRAAGVAFTIWETYDARPLRPAAGEIEAALGGRRPDAVLILSQAQAEGFAETLSVAPALFRPLPRLLCLSARVAAALPEELRARASISASRDLPALFERLP